MRAYTAVRKHSMAHSGGDFSTTPVLPTAGSSVKDVLTWLSGLHGFASNAKSRELWLASLDG